MPPAPPLSPCIRICQLDAETGWCIGCGRTGDEIGDWLFMSTGQRLALMAELPRRLARLASDQDGAAAGPDQPIRAS
ncbi:MAG: DUF1289 domain-containing protein [Beijerinckiaceae bacterium]|nr:DUF1289 domain-containing protein [Beijerinckiaceae bacterium]MCZ8299796.1 DUF1289 domain-containing protein [Beijerinckiaceae bacterium]